MTGLVERLRETDWGPNVADTLTRWDEARREAADAITRLRRYAVHGDDECVLGPCTCGLTALLAELGEG